MGICLPVEARVKITTFSPVVVLMSWCRLNTLTPAIPRTIASRNGRAVSSNWSHHELLLKPADPVRDGGFDFSLCSHGDRTGRPRSGRTTGDSGLENATLRPPGLLNARPGRCLPGNLRNIIIGIGTKIHWLSLFQRPRIGVLRGMPPNRRAAPIRM